MTPLEYYKENEKNNNHCENIELLCNLYASARDRTVAKIATNVRDHGGGLDEPLIEFQAKVNKECYPLLVQGVNAHWVYEVSSGFPGWRCTKCAHWIYDKRPFDCNCKDN